MVLINMLLLLSQKLTTSKFNSSKHQTESDNMARLIVCTMQISRLQIKNGLNLKLKLLGEAKWFLAATR